MDGRDPRPTPRAGKPEDDAGVAGHLVRGDDPAEQARFRDELRTIAGDAGLTRDYLLRISMIASLKRAAELG